MLTLWVLEMKNYSMQEIEQCINIYVYPEHFDEYLVSVDDGKITKIGNPERQKPTFTNKIKILKTLIWQRCQLLQWEMERDHNCTINFKFYTPTYPPW